MLFRDCYVLKQKVACIVFLQCLRRCNLTHGGVVVKPGASAFFVDRLFVSAEVLAAFNHTILAVLTAVRYVCAQELFVFT